jgi:hypothetical protein
METHDVYLLMFDICPISYSANVKAKFEFSTWTDFSRDL